MVAQVLTLIQKYSQNRNNSPQDYTVSMTTMVTKL